MTSSIRSSQRHYSGIMISSTFTDLKKHRAALSKAIKAHGLTDVAMENDYRKNKDIIESSLQMVSDGSAYIAVIGKKYGQIPESSKHNPQNLSLSELEFNEALRLGRPIMLFIMGEKHLVLESDIETDPQKKQKLDEFRERAKRIKPDSSLHRVYSTFNSLEEFKDEISPSIAELRRHLDEKSELPGSNPDPIPKPPELYAKPIYIGSHKFIGRQAQLETLNDWAQPANPHTILLFEAIGGNGKSMLTWEWSTKHVTKVSGNWAGRFWYSFYEGDAKMANFCQHSLAYITGLPLEDFSKKKTSELAEQLLHNLQDQPWLLILDGLERVLVHYHRIDAAAVQDEEVNQPTDQITNRDPCSTIRPEDDDLLRRLASAAPSKLLISSRLVPRVLMNNANQPIPGVQRISLPGLLLQDAEKLLRSCGITGDSKTIQNFLSIHCDCHPLVIGVLAGLVNDYLPDRGNFDAWAADPAYGGKLNLANLDLIQKRNHILKTSLKVLNSKSRTLLLTLAILSEAVDYPTLCAFNPYLPPEPEEVGKPQNPELSWRWNEMSNTDKLQAQQEFQTELKRRREYEQAVKKRLQSPEYLSAPKELSKIVLDLERRGLLQYDAQIMRYDLHPVVRGVAAGDLLPKERDHYGQRVVDYFSNKPHNPYADAETLEDISSGLNVVRTLLKMERYQEASNVYRQDLFNVLLYNLEAHTEVLSILRPFFPNGWNVLPAKVDKYSASYLASIAGNSLMFSNESKAAIAAYSSELDFHLNDTNWDSIPTIILNISNALLFLHRLGKQDRYLDLGLQLAELIGRNDNLFFARYLRYRQLGYIGDWKGAEAMWLLLNPMGRSWRLGLYRPGNLERFYCEVQFWKGELNNEQLLNAEQVANEGKMHQPIRMLKRLRGKWHLSQDRWALAAESLNMAVQMARKAGIPDAEAETQLAIANFHLDQLSEPHKVAEQLAHVRKPAHLALAELLLAIDDLELAKNHALKAYKWAWADGEPFVHRYELDKASNLLEKIGAEVPKFQPYVPIEDEKLPLEDELSTAIEKLRNEKNNKT